MKIKKPSSGAPTVAPAPATGGATIADRFKLDMPGQPFGKPPSKSSGTGGVNKTFAAVGLAASLAAIAILGAVVMFMSSSWNQIRFQ